MSLENLNSKELFIYSTHRSMASQYQQDSICKPSILRKDFFNKVVYYPHKILLPKNVRKLLLGNILEEYDKQTNKLLGSHLVFEKNFLAYLQSSAFFLQFYDELFIHNINIADIPLQDTYGDYEEHLHILQEIFARYNAFLDSKNLVYKSREYEILSVWVKNFSRIVIYLDSVLNPYEKEILSKVARFCEVVICFQTHDIVVYDKSANEKHNAMATHTFDNIATYFLQIFDKPLILEPFTHYEVRYPQGEIISKKPCPMINTHISAKSFFGRIEQVGGIKECIKHWLDRGVSPKDITIVLPDSGFIKYLQALDKEHNFNYAMGKKFSEDTLFKEIQSRIEDLQTCNVETLSDIISQSLKADNNEHISINEKITQVLYDYECAQKFFPLQDIGKSFLQDIGELSIDDNRGGKISVIEVLESRGLNLQYVIVPDCNEDKIPSLSMSDMFLTTAIRERLHIPTVYDKKALQLWHYKSLLFGAKEACMLLVDSEDCAPCILLNTLNITPTKSNASIFSHQLTITPYKQESYFAPLGFDFSPSSLKTLLECPRQYYFKYIANLCLPALDSKDNALFGNIIHEVLHQAYTPYKDKTIDMQAINTIADSCIDKLLQREFENANTLSALQNIHIETMLLEAKRFFAKEREFIKQNGAFTLLELEKEFKEFGLTSYTFKGRIDRIQQNQDNSILVIDYKYKTFDEKFEDLALEIYRQYIAQTYPNNEVRAGFYFFKENIKKSGELYKPQENMQEKLSQQLSELDKKFCHTKAQILSQNTQNCVIKDSSKHNLQFRYGEFEPLGKQNKTKTCKYCDYRTLCGI